MLADGTAVIADRYARAEELLLGHAGELIVGGEVRPSFIGSEDRFWFVETTAAGHCFVTVDPERGEIAPAFDHRHLADALSQASGEACDADRLPFGELIFAADRALLFAAHGRQWRYDADGCEDIGDAEEWSTWVLSPDARWAVKRLGNDVSLVEVATGRERRLTSDATAGRRYGVHVDWFTFRVQRRGGHALKPLVLWSPDSRHLAFELIDERDVARGHLLDTTDHRPSVHSFAYALPGDDRLPMSSFLVASVEGGSVTPVDLDPVPVSQEAQIAMGYARWSPDSTRLELLVRGRFGRDAQLVAVEPRSGAARTVVDERDELLVEPSESWLDRPCARILDRSGALWFSRRDGWGHLWHVDGDRWRQVTRGPWVVREVMHIDEADGDVFFTASGREAGRHPYHRYLYRVSLQGGEPELLTPEDGDHQISFAPSGRWFVDCWSSNTDPPVTALRRAGGEVVRELSAADVSRLRAAAWSEPIPFAVTAADGETAIHGVLYPPPEIDEDAPVPLVDVIYPGPMKGASNFRFGLSMYHCEAIAALGFAVATIEGRGTPHRSRAFGAASYGDLGFATLLADHVAAIEQLADRHPWIDGDRVGIIGGSGGGYASVRAMLTHPNVYSVAVSAAGNHDNRRLVAGWGEPYLGPVDEDLEAWERQSNVALAANLRGRLLLAWGCVDNNVPPSSSVALLRALIEANRNVDLLVLPDEDHFFFFESPYFVRRCWDYLVEHLRGEVPPAYEIARRSLITVW